MVMISVVVQELEEDGKSYGVGSGQILTDDLHALELSEPPAPIWHVFCFSARSVTNASTHFTSATHISVDCLNTHHPGVLPFSLP